MSKPLTIWIASGIWLAALIVGFLVGMYIGFITVLFRIG